MSTPGSAREPLAHVGFIGVGDMGGPMAQNLVHAGHPVTVFDLSRARMDAVAGAQAASGAEDVARAADIVLACLDTTDAMRDVARAVASTGRPRVYADHSTSGPTLAREIRALFDGTPIAMLDAPISGMVDRARDGTLTLMVSGPAEAFELTRPVFEVIGGHVFFLGDIPGGGQMMKVANNLINNVQTLATCEAVAMGLKYGLDPAQMFDVLNVSTGRNSQTEGQLRAAVLANDFSRGAAIAISKKDISLAVDEAERLGILAPGAAASRAVVEAAIAERGEQQRSSAIFSYVAMRSGVTLPASPSGGEPPVGKP